MSEKLQKGISTAATVIIVLIILIGGVAIAYSISQNQNETDTTPEEQMDGDSMEDDAMTEDNETMDDGSDDAMMEDDDDQAMEDDSAGDAMTGDEEAMTPETKTFNMTGVNFAFSQTEIRVKRGDRVVINFESLGGFHDWTLDGYGVGTQSVNPGIVTSVEFVADQAGTFEYFCSVGNHRQMGMVGTLIVE